MTRTHPEPQDAPSGKSKDIVVFIIRRDTKCAECGEELGRGAGFGWRTKKLSA